MLPCNFLTALAIVGLSAAQIQIPPSNAADCPRTMCLDGINPECGIRWGGCYDMCQPRMKPTMPPCKSTLSKSTISRTPKPPFTRPTRLSLPVPTRSPTITRAPPSLSLRPTSSDNCSTRSVCVDYINECGQWYGGCHADCKPWPSYSKPLCTSTPSLTVNPSTLPTDY
ncbi:hypothetical protein CORC01_03385 [Colletotrichum orchidophilum]|uniref:Uncharacterized protein n=1 Tax=Colletotrichum orchidophilum TaxID=1209926 RepID=A0A1G4BIT8_9PEZI|nr:uncharacterized protein CORC01_03385 [Colletotrichum orchidophilum]OHF01352.1 hypothetical protein CORC01_03385 [Colletotrichum orchidophilum]